MPKHPMTRRILKHQFSVCWGNQQNLHSCHIEEYEITIDEITDFIRSNKRQIDVKDFREFIDGMNKSYNVLKNSIKEVCENGSK